MNDQKTTRKMVLARLHMNKVRQSKSKQQAFLAGEGRLVRFYTFVRPKLLLIILLFQFEAGAAPLCSQIFSVSKDFSTSSTGRTNGENLNFWLEEFSQIMENRQPPLSHEFLREILSTNDIHAIDQYAGNLFVEINNYYRNNLYPSNGIEWRCPLCFQLERALKKIPRYYGFSERSIRAEEGSALFQGYTTVGNVVTEAAFVSTSRLHGQGPGNLILKIIGSSGRSIENYNSSFPGEGEILFLPGTKFEVIHVKKRNNIPSDNTLYVYLREISDP